MQTVEFKSKSYNGIIEIPSIHKEWYDKIIKVILLTDTESEIRGKVADFNGDGLDDKIAVPQIQPDRWGLF